MLPDWSNEIIPILPIIPIIWYLNLTIGITKDQTCVNMPYAHNLLPDWFKMFKQLVACIFKTSHIEIYCIGLVSVDIQVYLIGLV